MTIYEIRSDVERYQLLELAEPGRALGPGLVCDCDRRAEVWDPPKIRVANPGAKRGNFFTFGGGDPLICDQRACDALDYIFETCAEVLPLPFEGETLYLINVLTCLNLLDVKRSTWRTNPPEGLPTDYVFFPQRMQEAPLFKIPQTSAAQVLTAEGFLDEEYDFKLCVERAGLEGLIFQRLWSDDRR